MKPTKTETGKKCQHTVQVGPFQINITHCKCKDTGQLPTKLWFDKGDFKNLPKKEDVIKVTPQRIGIDFPNPSILGTITKKFYLSSDAKLDGDKVLCEGYYETN